MRVELSLGHVTPVPGDDLLDLLLPAHVRRLVGVHLEPPARRDVERRLADERADDAAGDDHPVDQGGGDVHPGERRGIC